MDANPQVDRPERPAAELIPKEHIAGLQGEAYIDERHYGAANYAFNDGHAERSTSSRSSSRETGTSIRTRRTNEPDRSPISTTTPRPAPTSGSSPPCCRMLTECYGNPSSGHRLGAHVAAEDGNGPRPRRRPDRRPRQRDRLHQRRHGGRQRRPPRRAGRRPGQTAPDRVRRRAPRVLETAERLEHEGMRVTPSHRRRSRRPARPRRPGATPSATTPP